MRLFIAEKPELAKAIVEALGGGTPKQGYYECVDNDVVTYCFGHMLKLFEPSDYDARYSKWMMDDLPFSFIPWKKKPDSGTENQLNIVMKLIKDAAMVVHAGDPDAEGQLLIDEVLQYAKCQAPVKRVLINDLNKTLVQRVIANMEDNQNFAGLSAAAEARSVADQLYGFNLSRAYTLAAQAKGYTGTLAVGRVATPILGLIVRRDREIESHKKTIYYTIRGQFKFADREFPANYKISPSDSVDYESNRLVDKQFCKTLAAALKGKPATIVEAGTQIAAQAPPLPYNLLKLQADAFQKHGYKPDVVKNVTQALREKHKLITYNRSDCQYLSEIQHVDGPQVLQAIAANLRQDIIANCDVSIKSKAFNDARVSAHHAIIPTMVMAKFDGLSKEEQDIYRLIANAYVMQFMPDFQYKQTKVLLEVENHQFSCTGKIPLKLGWKEFEVTGAKTNESDDEAIILDLDFLQKDQAGQCLHANVKEHETKPRPRYTFSSLLTDLTQVARYIKDARLRDLLISKDKEKAGERGGIGTPATRDSIIKNLFERGYIQENKKSIISTEPGRKFYDALPDLVRYPDMTALWHEQQLEIESGHKSVEDFIKDLNTYIAQEISRIKQDGMGTMAVLCSKCKTGHLNRFMRKDKEAYFWKCKNADCGTFFNDEHGKPIEQANKSVILSNYDCPLCNNKLVLREGHTKSKNKYKFWGCSNYPHCKYSANDNAGIPAVTT